MSRYVISGLALAALTAGCGIQPCSGLGDTEVEQLTEVPPYDEIRTVWWNDSTGSGVDHGRATATR